MGTSRVCEICGDNIPWYVEVDGVRRNVNDKRKRCLTCQPLRKFRVKLCPECGDVVPPSVVIDGKRRGFAHRTHCLKCVPFGNPGTVPAARRSRAVRRGIDRRNTRRRGVKAWAVRLLGSCCSRCGYARNLAALDFHHTDGTKETNISDLLVCHDRTRLENELRKCVLLCRNCHHEHHHPDMDVVAKGRLEELAGHAYFTKGSALVTRPTA